MTPNTATKISLYFIPFLLLGSILAIFAWLIQPTTSGPAPVNKTSQTTAVNLYLFWAHGCSACEKAQISLDSMIKDYPQVNIVRYEVYLDGENRKIYKSFLDALQQPPQGLPTIIVGNGIWTGFQPAYTSEIKEAIDICILQGCPDINQNLNSSQPVNAILREKESPPTKTQTLNFPLLGSVQLSQKSLITNTLLIGLIDGFNPCSLWVLGVLLSLATYSKSRLLTFIIGGAFILTSALIYGLFITGIFSIISILGFLNIIRVMVMVIALLFGLVNIKDYFFFKQGVSFTIADNKKPGIYQKIRNLIFDEKSLFSMLAGVITLAAGVSLVEFSCTSGFPVIWSNLLATEQLAIFSYCLLLLLYLLVYMSDEIIIFASVVISLQSIKLKQEQGRFLKLISGVTIATLGMIMLIHPQWMNELASASVIFLLSLTSSLVIHFVTRLFYSTNQNK